MDSKLCRCGGAYHSYVFVCSKDVDGICEEISNLNKLAFCNRPQLGHGAVPHLVKGNVVFRRPNGILEEVEPSLSLRRVVVEEEFLELVHGSRKI